MGLVRQLLLGIAGSIEREGGGTDRGELMTATTDMTTDIGTVIDGEEAVKYGIIDRVGGLGDAVAELKSMIKKEQNR